MNPPDTLQSLIKRPLYADRFKEVLHERTDQFVSSLLQVGASMPDVEPKSIMAAAMTSAALDLPINKNLGFAWIIPYNDNKSGRRLAQFQMGWKGYVQLALRTGQYSRMNARALNKECFVEWDDLGQPVIDWKKFDPDAKPSMYWFGFDMGSVKQRFIWTKEQAIAHARRYSQSFRKGADIWKAEEDKMHLKGLVKLSLAHWGILSVHMQQAIQEDAAVKLDIDAKPQYEDNFDSILEASEPSRGEIPAETSQPHNTSSVTAISEASAPLAGDVSKPASTKQDSTEGSPADAPATPPRRGRPPKTNNPHEAVKAIRDTIAEISEGLPLISPTDAKVSAAPKNAQEAFGKICEANGITFEQFKSWCIAEQYPIRDLDSIGSYYELPERICKLWVQDSEFTVKSIKARQ